MSRLIKDKDYKITENYGKNHVGVDIVGTTGGVSYIKAHSDGIVYNVVDGKNNDRNSSGVNSYGNYIQLKHSDGYYTLYAHLHSRTVQVGQTVEKGQQIGTMGHTGFATGTHVHFGLYKNGLPYRDGIPLDPLILYR